MSLHWYDRLRKRDPFMGRFCGWTYPYPNLTDSLTQRYLTLIWHTNGIREDKGWRLMATRVWPGIYLTSVINIRALTSAKSAFVFNWSEAHLFLLAISLICERYSNHDFQQNDILLHLSRDMTKPTK